MSFALARPEAAISCTTGHSEILLQSRRRSGPTLQVVRTRRLQRAHQVVRASAAPAEIAQPGLETAIEIARSAAKDANSVPARQLFAALNALDKNKPKGIDWPGVLAGKGNEVRRWRLAYTAGAKELAQAMKGKQTRGGLYWSVPPAAIGYKADGSIENGVYLGWLASLRFEGNYEVKQNKVGFEFSKLLLKVGPWAAPPITLKKTPTTTWQNPAKADGLFILVYGDDEVMVARGKGGGIALWQRALPSWELENGVA